MQVPIPKRFKKRIEKQRDPDEKSLNESLEKSINDIDKKIDHAIPDELQGGEIVTINIKAGNNEIPHNLKRFPEGFIVLNGAYLTEVSKSKFTYTLYSGNDKTDCKIWIF